MAQWTLSHQQKVALPSLAVGLAFFLVAFSVHFWVKVSTGDDNSVNGGLWTVCAHNGGYTVCSQWTDDRFKAFQRDWFHKNQALQCLSLVLLLGTLGALVAHFLTRLKAAIVASIICCFMAAFFTILGCVLFAIDVNNDRLYSTYGRLDWAFGFSIVGGVFMVISGAATILHVMFATTTTTTASSTPYNAPV